MQNRSFPGVSASIESACTAGDLGLIPELGRFPGKGKGSPFQYSGLENSIDCVVHEVAKGQTRLRYFHMQNMVASQVAFVVKIQLPMQDARPRSLIPGSGRSSGEGNGSPLQYSCLGNPTDRESWWATVHGVVKSQI